MSHMERRVFTLQEVAEQLRLPYELVRDKVYSGAWPHVKFSEWNRRMTQEQVDSVIAMSEHKPTPATTSDAHRRRARVQALLSSM